MTPEWKAAEWRGQSPESQSTSAIGQVKSQFADFEAAASAKAHEAADRAREAAHYTAEKARGACRSTDELIQEKPYYAMGFAALAGLVVGVLLQPPWIIR